MLPQPLSPISLCFVRAQAFVQHYSQCSSVGEIVVVWNKGTPPDPVRDLGAGGVPVRIRAEAANSMNNRFRPDPELKNRCEQVWGLHNGLLLQRTV